MADYLTLKFSVYEFIKYAFRFGRHVDFNPNLMESYRLIGYENRKLNNRDFENDDSDADTTSNKISTLQFLIKFII